MTNVKNEIKQWLTYQPLKPVQHLAIYQEELLNAVWKHCLCVNLLVAVGAGELLGDQDPNMDAELVKLMSTAKTKCVIFHC